MEKIKFNGKLKIYVMLPVYMSLAFLIGVIMAYTYSFAAGLTMTGVFGLYIVVVLIFYNLCKNRFTDEIIDYAVHYGTVQRELMHNFDVPYALLDSSTRFMWMNDKFTEIVDKEANYNKAVAGVFPEITKEIVDKNKENTFSISVNYNDRRYKAILQRIEIPGVAQGSEITNDLDSQEHLITLILTDETELISLKQTNIDQHMVMALIYIDNYDEVVETVEAVKKSMLRALIDRKISKYFAPYDAIIRRVEKDKYIIFFQHKYLAALKNDNFALIEDIRSVKMGNESEITLSMGVGVSDKDYKTNSDYAHMAIDVALARGGAQVVVKDTKEVTYFGSHGKEVESNSRVKARVKAQALRELMVTRDQVIVMGHKVADADCMGAACGAYCAAKNLGKKCHIVMNTVTSSMRPLVESFAETGEYPEDMFITGEEALNIVDDNTLLMVVDTNRKSYVDTPELIEKCKHIVVIDHHRRSDDYIENPLLSYVEPYASSASEMMTEMLQYFDEKMTLTDTEADCIYAGILIDTNNFMTKTGVRTFEAAAYLRRNGAEVTRVRKLLREDMNAYKARAEVVRHAEVYKNYFAISAYSPESEIESPTIVAAKAANELLNIVGIKASFVLTEWEEKIYVSSRSIDEINVNTIMEKIGGGGHLNVAGAQIMGSTLNEVKVRVKAILDEMIEKGDIKL